MPIQTERITEGADYDGIRIRFLGALGSARIHMQIDIGFGAVVYPEPKEFGFSDHTGLSGTALSSATAARAPAQMKFEAMVKLSMLRSRMKDFYDIWWMSRLFDFEGRRLTQAIQRTFEQRGTALPSEIEVFTQPFIDAKKNQWMAFRKRLQQDHVPASFGEITAAVSRFLWPIVAALYSRNQARQTGSHPGHGPEPISFY